MKKVYGFGITDVPASTMVGNKQIWNRSYKLWSAMLQRCYDPYILNIYPTYIPCTVCDEWLYYSNYIEWFDKQPNNYTKGYAVDKDLLVVGNTVYSPEHCLFLPSIINTFIAVSGHGKRKSDPTLPIGVRFHSRDHVFESFCMNPYTKKYDYLGRFPDADTAHKAWLKHKISFAIRLADDYNLRNDAKQALINRWG